MAASLLLLLDDIASVLDDVATMTKVAAVKTAGVVGDDLAVNARQVAGVRADRELPVVAAVAAGSAVNKLILVPAALAVSLLAPWAITPLLVAGGVYLCYEGMEKVLHAFHGGRHAPAAEDVAVDERGKIRGAIRTDFILSAEIIVIALGVVAGRPLVVQLGVLAAIAVAMTVGVYGLVAAIIKLDDLGTLLAAGRGPGRACGRLLLAAAPLLMRFLSVAGTVAMFLVGGGIVTHAFPWLHAMVTPVAGHGPEPHAAGWWPTIAARGADLVVGMVVGLVALAAVAAWRRTGAGTTA
jgi:predicted DNA repair protein MutK